jgi:hypothetical protein
MAKNTQTAMDLIDAGVPEVIQMYNRAYAQSMRNGTAIKVTYIAGEGLARTPVFSMRAAHTLALEVVADMLDYIDSLGWNEDNEAEAAREDAREVEVAWLLATNSHSASIEFAWMADFVGA